MEGEQWIILNGKKLLWLPPEALSYRSAVKDKTLALGCHSGRICFMKFG